ncbi:uncharacterized protein LODBEIA_P01940 [Lodderomyces beijingensis]|uniref:mRNA m(6)A methyltransferase n=1 Tax=Lodderomyces beijingensis TaxID=1775926 RepID=A0ABP0ZI07_9ASCO
MLYRLNDFEAITDFLIEYHEKLSDFPSYRDFWKVYPLFVNFCSPHKCVTSQQDFKAYLLQFTAISKAIKFKPDLVSCSDRDLGRVRIEWISIDALKILKKKLQQNDDESTKTNTNIHTKNNTKTSIKTSSKNKTTNRTTSKTKSEKNEQPRQETPRSQTLLDFAQDKSCQTAPLAEATHLTLNIVLEFLNKHTAKTILGKQRAHLNTQTTPFPLVCSEPKHALSLANVGLNRRDLANSNLRQLSSETAVHHRIHQSRNSLNLETYQCSLDKIHFLPIVYNHTDLNLGDCSYLDTCHKMKTCRYLHYYTLNPVAKPGHATAKPQTAAATKASDYTLGQCFTESFRQITPPQWISCDVRLLPFKILGKFAAIISDPAWDIHMSLPYSTCKDDELLELPMHELQDEGIIMLWVTGRSIEIGRRALLKWGYSVSDEMIWIKLNQLKRTIVTGRTGHWLNHSKEHLLVGLKGNPIWLNCKIDTDVVVSNTRETSRKPDEFYEIIERMVGKHARKLEIFGRTHNTRPGWLTIGNQLQGVSLSEPELRHKYETYVSSHM